ncbi:MAG: recombinase RecT [Cyclobacteriaceae bacterium]|nr:recombinase RecT [Cyclobacteriaceae bacterium]
MHGTGGAAASGLSLCQVVDKRGNERGIEEMKNAIAVLKNDVLVERFSKVAPKSINYESEYAFAVQHLKANDYLLKIAEASPDSLLSAMSNVAAVGLSLNPAAKEAYLVPRKGKICFDPSYMGLIKLATDSGSILWVQADIVYANDSFIDNGIGEKPIHQKDPFSKDRGEFVGCYCTAKTKDGDYLTTTMSADEVRDIMNRSESVKKGSFSPWNSDFFEMAKKTVLKRAWKLWPRSNHHEHEYRLATAIDISHQNEDIEFKKTSPDLGQYSDETKAYFDDLLVKSDAIGMYTLQRTMEAAMFTSLYHSFGKGEKGKYQRIVDDLLEQGFNMFKDYCLMYSESVESGDDLQIKQIEDELPAETVELIKQEIGI